MKNDIQINQGLLLKKAKDIPVLTKLPEMPTTAHEFIDFVLIIHFCVFISELNENSLIVFK